MSEATWNREYTIYPGGSGRSPCEFPKIHEKCMYGALSDGQRRRRPFPPYSSETNDLFFERSDICGRCQRYNTTWIIDTNSSYLHRSRLGKGESSRQLKKKPKKSKRDAITRAGVALECRSKKEILEEKKNKVPSD